MRTVTVDYKVDGKEAWSAKQVAEHMGLSPGRISHFVTAGDLTPCASLSGPGGRMWLFLPKDVERLRLARADSTGGREGGWQGMSATTMNEVSAAFLAYREVVSASGLAPQSQRTYVRHAETFVRWLHGDFVPGARK